TVGGYLTSLLGKIPEPGETAEIEGFQAEVIRSDDRAVQEIRFTRILDATVDVVEEMSAGLSSTNEKVE
ncbi:MAG TPA: transporter associated domain-containing protein, partial [Verrucomicrobiales bacterium]|nr:transporter associated domain-containing protein [Verrucomicrobiales bacterium]